MGDKGDDLSVFDDLVAKKGRGSTEDGTTPGMTTLVDEPDTLDEAEELEADPDDDERTRVLDPELEPHKRQASEIDLDAALAPSRTGPASGPAPRAKTLLGMAAALPPPPAPPPSFSPSRGEDVRVPPPPPPPPPPASGALHPPVPGQAPPPPPPPLPVNSHAPPVPPKTVIGIGPGVAPPPSPTSNPRLPPPPSNASSPNVGMPPGSLGPAAAPPLPPMPSGPPPHGAPGALSQPKLDPREVDWDDEDEVTEIYSREAHGARPEPDRPRSVSLPGPLPPPPAPLSRTSSVPPPPPPPPVARSAPSKERITPPPVPVVVPAPAPRPPPQVHAVVANPPRRRSSLPMILLAAVALSAVGFGAYLLARPTDGVLLVTVSGPGDTAVEDVKVLVDGEPRCTASPCRVTLLSGAHTIRVSAPGFAKSADRPVVIRPGTDEIVNFSLSAEGGGTGLRASAKAKGMRLYVDGSDRGELPVTIDDLTPGAHEIRIAGNEAYKPYTEQITIAAGEMRQLEPSLELLKRVARVELGTNALGAQVTLECGSDRRMLAPPTSVEIDPQQSCRLLAAKTGFEDFTQPLSFDAGEAEQTITVALVEKGAAAAPRPTPRGTPGARPKPAEVAKPAAGTGTIRINSIPVSSVLVDGRPVGQTPTQATVSAGNHTVTFVHPEKGRKAVGVTVQAGQSATAVVRF